MKLKEWYKYYKMFGVRTPNYTFKKLSSISAERILDVYTECKTRPNSFGESICKQINVPISKSIEFFRHSIKFIEVYDDYINEDYNSNLIGWSSDFILDRKVSAWFKENNINTFDDLKNMSEEDLILFKLQVLNG